MNSKVFLFLAMLLASIILISAEKSDKKDGSKSFLEFSTINFCYLLMIIFYTFNKSYCSFKKKVLYK
jgi:hypothetical protein